MSPAPGLAAAPSRAPLAAVGDLIVYAVPFLGKRKARVVGTSASGYRARRATLARGVIRLADEVTHIAAGEVVRVEPGRRRS